MALQQQILPIYAGCQSLPCRGILRHSTQIGCKFSALLAHASGRKIQFEMPLLRHAFDAAH